VIAVLFIFVFVVVAAGSWLVFQYFAIATIYHLSNPAPTQPRSDDADL
jgi:hypothetical protein